MTIAFANWGPRVTGSKFVVAPAADVKKVGLSLHTKINALAQIIQFERAAR